MRRLLCFVVALAFAIAATDARADSERGEGSGLWDGLAQFVALARAELGDARVTASGSIDYAHLTPRDAIVLVHPTRELDIESLSRFMHDGGRVVLLDDFGTGDALLEHYSIERSSQPRDPAQMLRHNPSLAIAIAASDPPHSTVAGVARVVTNHSTSLKQPELTPVLTVPTASGERPMLALAGAVGDGRLLAVGDSSVVINAMLRYPGNKEFARGLVHYALEGDSWGERGGTLVVVAGEFAQVGAYGAAADTGALSGAIRQIRDAARAMGQTSAPPVAMFAMAAVVALGVVLWTGSRAARLHAPSTPRYARPVPIAAQGGVAGHAALIAAPGTSRILALLELKSALDEELAFLCELREPVSGETLLRSLADQHLLERKGLLELRALLLRLGKAETYVLAARMQLNMKVSDAEVVVVARAALKVLQEARARANTRVA